MNFARTRHGLRDGSGGATDRKDTLDASPTNRTRWLALIILCLGDLMIVLDTTIVNVALPSIRADLGFTQTSLAWVVNAYLLTFGGFLLLGGRLGDLFGAPAALPDRHHALHRRLGRVRALDDAGHARSAPAPCRASVAPSSRPSRSRSSSISSPSRASARRRWASSASSCRAAARSASCSAACSPTRSTGTGSSSSTSRSASLVYLLSLRLLPAAPGLGTGRVDVAGAVTVTASLILAVYAIVKGNEVGWVDARDARPARRSRGALRRLRPHRVACVLAARAAAPLQAAERRDGERRRHALVGRDVRLVLPRRAVSPARARLQPVAGRPRVPAREHHHGRLLGRALREARHALRREAAARDRAAARGGRACCSSRMRRSAGASSWTSCRR